METKSHLPTSKHSLNLYTKSSIFLFLIGIFLLIFSATMDDTEKKYDEEHYARTGGLLYKWNRTKPMVSNIGIGVLVLGAIVFVIGNNKKK